MSGGIIERACISQEKHIQMDRVYSLQEKCHDQVILANVMLNKF